MALLNSLFVRILLLTLGLGSTVYAEGPVLLGVRGNESATTEFLEKNSQLQRAESETVEFPNGNTFVRLQGDLSNRDVVILLPEQLHANQLMEVLIKIRTARTNGAQSIVVASPISLGKIRLEGMEHLQSDVPLESWLQVAGATHIRNGKSTSRKAVKRENRAPMIAPTAPAWVLGQNHGQLAKSIAEETGLPLQQNPVPSKIRKKGSQVYMVVGAGMNVNQSLFESLATADRLTRFGNRVAMITPNLPYARSDKVDQPNVTVTGRLIADLIESTGTSGVTFVRAHAPQSQGFFKRQTKEITGRPTINAYLKGMGVQAIVSPDNGFQKDATKYADDLEVESGTINKQRDPLNPTKLRIAGYSGVNVKGKVVSIVDDETASGSTLAQAAEYLKKRGAKKVIAVVTHLTGNAQKALDSPFLDEVVVTNTLPINVEHPKLKILDIHGEIVQFMKEQEQGRSEGRFVCEDSISALKF